jgi:protein involved in polysaccharide export with SLBB domain
LLADGDIVRVDPIFSNYRETVTLRGSVANPGRFLWHQGMRLSELMPDKDSLLSRDYWWRRTQLGLPAPELAAPAGTEEPTEKPAAVSSPEAQTDWNYAVIERQEPSTMTTALIPFNLGKLVLDHDVSQDLDLKPGDVVTIFSQNDIHPPIDEQTKYVRLEGEFAHAGIYSVAPGETLRSLVVRAGGLTGKAYLYGSEFTRKSTQAIEQKRFNEYIDRLGHQLARSSIASSSLAGSSGQGGTHPDQIMFFNNELLARLRQLRPTGRIVLNLHPHSVGENELPDTPLEDGDTFFVPFIPATVQVLGAVLNQNAFLYRSGGRVGDYLHLAGGPTRDADRGQIFVLRANGSVTSRNSSQSVFASSGFDNLRLYPGDTIVVPEKSVQPRAMREFLAWTQMFSQLALGAAAIDVIK